MSPAVLMLAGLVAPALGWWTLHEEPPTITSACGIPPSRQINPSCEDYHIKDDVLPHVADGLLWPPRCGNEKEWHDMPVHRHEFVRRVTFATRAEAGLGVEYNVSVNPHWPCIVHASIALPFGSRPWVYSSSAPGRKYGCPFRMDVCRHQELTRAVRNKPFWDAQPLSPIWAEASAFGPTQFQAWPRNWDTRTWNHSLGNISRQFTHPVPPPRFRSCVVVGGAPTLVGSGLGSRIDSHEAVFRFNDHPVGGDHAADVGSKTTVHVLQSARSVKGSANIIQRDSTMVVQIVGRRSGYYSSMRDALHSNRTWIISADAFLAFHQSFDEVGGSGPYGVWLSLLLCETPPLLVGFSTLKSNLTKGFEHYYRGAAGERMDVAANVPHAAMWLHVLSSLGLVVNGPA